MPSAIDDGRSSPPNTFVGACVSQTNSDPVEKLEVNDRLVENMTGCMQEQHRQQELLNKCMQLEASTFAHLVGKYSRGTGVFHLPNPISDGNIPPRMKTRSRQRKQEVEVPPLRNPHEARENGLAEHQGESSYHSLAVDINLPKEWTY